MTTIDPLRRRVLWVDDDEPGRFEVECVIIQEDLNAKLDWARTVDEAVTLLGNYVYAAIILDQMLADLHTPMEQVPWGGCALLFWLRGRSDKPWGNETSWQCFEGTRPNEENVRAPVLFVSGFRDEEVWASTQAVVPEVNVLGKPLNCRRLRHFLEQAFGGVNNP